MRGYNLLVVDDDVNTRQMLGRVVNGEIYGLHRVSFEQSGEKAWRTIQDKPVDILILDIKMPVVNEIQLLKKIEEHYPDIQVIVLTECRDFEYARQAVRYHAFDYLLKPVDEKQLGHTILRALSVVKRNKELQLNSTEYLKLKQNDFYKKILQGRMTRSKISTSACQLAIPLMSGLSSVICIAFDVHPNSQIETYQSEMYDEIHQQMLDILESYCSTIVDEQQECLRISVIEPKENQVVILLTTSNKNEEKWLQDLKKYAEDIRALILGQDYMEAMVALGTIHQEIYGLYDSYRAAMRALKRRHLYTNSQVLYGGDIEEASEEVDIIAVPSAHLLQHIRLGLQEEVKRDIESVFENLYSMKYISLESIRMIVTELAIVAFKGQTIAGESNVSYLHFLKEIQKMTTLEGLKNKLLDLATQIAIRRREERIGQKKIAEDALAYLSEHFHEENLCLSNVAEHMYISETYLSIILKQETGKTFSMYLLEFRMKRAMKLLRSSDAKHYEIAQLVGYSNPQYFSVCFKKYTGMTPTQFREID